MGYIIGEEIPRVHSDVAGSPSESRNPGALARLMQAFNELLFSTAPPTVNEVAEIVATERRVAGELYPSAWKAEQLRQAALRRHPYARARGIKEAR